MLNLENFPYLIQERYNAVEEAAENPAERHKKLLDLCETLLLYICGILFGEYKKSGKVNITIETDLYKHSKRIPTLGVFQSFNRELLKVLEASILIDKFDNKIFYERVANVAFSFEILKQVVDEGADEKFKEQTNPLRKGKTVKKIGLMKFFDFFIEIRNINAHPEERAGKAGLKRRWPLNHEYFQYLNDDFEDALEEIMQSLDALSNYRFAVAEDIFDEKSQVRFLIESGMNKSRIDLILPKEQIQNISLDERYLIDESNKIYSRLYYHSIPDVNSEVANEVVAKEKANLILPHLKQLIHDKLLDDQKIDALEYMVLWDTARIASFTELQLFDLIDKVRKEMNISSEVGTPDKKGSLFIEKHEEIKRLSFNPYWLKHFLWLQKISLDYQKEEKEVDKKFDSKIDSIKIDLKNLPGNDKIIKAEESIRSIKGKLKEIKSRQRGIPASFREKLKSTQSEERKNALNEEKTALEERLQLQIDKHEQEKQELQARIEELKNKQADRKDELIKKLERLKENKEAEKSVTTWGIQDSFWKEINQYVDGLLNENLNNEEGIDQEEAEKLWVTEPNSWQIGNLTHYYWGKIYPVNAPLKKIRHIGLWIGKNFKWVPSNIPESHLKERINQINIVLWTSVDDKLASKIESNESIFARYSELCQDMVNSNYSTLLKLGLNVKCVDKTIWENSSGGDKEDLFVSLEYYLTNLADTHQIKQLYSRVYTIFDFYENGQVKLEAITQMENEIQALLSLFSNIILELNDYAISTGMNKEEIKRREEQFVRYQKLLNAKFEKAVLGEGFKPTNEMIIEWKKYAFDTLGINHYSFDYILNSFRWKKNENN
jgi:hypothetical protein